MKFKVGDEVKVTNPGRLYFLETGVVIACIASPETYRVSLPSSKIPGGVEFTPLELERTRIKLGDGTTVEIQDQDQTEPKEVDWFNIMKEFST